MLCQLSNRDETLEFLEHSLKANILQRHSPATQGFGGVARPSLKVTTNIHFCMRLKAALTLLEPIWIRSSLDFNILGGLSLDYVLNIPKVSSRLLNWNLVWFDWKIPILYENLVVNPNLWLSVYVYLESRFKTQERMSIKILTNTLKPIRTHDNNNLKTISKSKSRPKI